MNREELIEYIKKNSPSHSETDFRNHTDEQLVLLQLAIDFDKKRKSIITKKKK